MKRTLVTLSICALLSAPTLASADQSHMVLQLAQNTTNPAVAGEVPLDATVIQAADLVHGWSVQKSMLGKTVKNDQNQNLGNIDDIIITPKDYASFAIIGVGGFLGIDQRKVAIPMNKLELRNGQWILPGATKDALKNYPPFVYAR